MKKILLILLCLLTFGCGKKVEETIVVPEPEEQNMNAKEKIEIVDVNSNTRPFAVVINNTSVAVKVQQGLQKAYMIYEVPVEGSLTRLLAFYKDIDDVKIGTIRSARHNFLDLAFEQDAIFVHWGWSRFARDQISSLNVNNLNGLSDSSFWRENPEGLSSEHTGYTSIAKSRELAKSKGYSLTTDKGLVFNYSLEEVNLSEKENSLIANNIIIPSSNELNTSYVYDEANMVYKRSVNGNPHLDHETKEQYTAKNIIIQKIATSSIKNSKYWELGLVGSGDGMFITNGYAISIKWSKADRYAKTKYTYLDGSEVLLNDGNLYVQLESTNQNYIIK